MMDGALCLLGLDGGLGFESTDHGLEHVWKALGECRRVGDVEPQPVSLGRQHTHPGVRRERALKLGEDAGRLVVLV